MPVHICSARDNPFRVERILQVRYLPLGADWPALWSRLGELRFCGAICGPEGSGKTTLLEDIAARLQAAGRTTRWLQLRRETRGSAPESCRAVLAGATPADILLLDGAEQLGPLAWRQFRRRARRHAGLIITAHRPGRLPTLVDCRTTVALLESIVARLVPDDIDALRDDLPALFTKHRGNVRDCLRALYDRYANAARSIARI